MKISGKMRAQAFKDYLIGDEVGECFSVDMVPNFSVDDPISDKSMYMVTGKFLIKDGEVVVTRKIPAMTAETVIFRALVRVDEKQGDPQ